MFRVEFAEVEETGGKSGGHNLSRTDGRKLTRDLHGHFSGLRPCQHLDERTALGLGEGNSSQGGAGIGIHI